jgi:hypothetical protein
VAVGLDDGAQDIAADAAETVNGNADGHISLPARAASCPGFRGASSLFLQSI